MTKEEEEVVQLFKELLTWLSVFQETKSVPLEMKMVEDNSLGWWSESPAGPFYVVSSEIGQLLLNKTTIWAFHISTPPNQPTLPPPGKRKWTNNPKHKRKIGKNIKKTHLKTNPHKKPQNPYQPKPKKPNQTAAVWQILYLQVHWVG